MRYLLLLLGLSLAACTSEPGAAPAEGFAAGAVLQVEGAWARPAADTAQGAGRTAIYFTLRNAGKVPDRLTSVRAEGTGTAEMHHSTMKEGVMRMRPVESVEVPPGEAVAFEPGGYHVMLTALQRPLAPGDRFPIRLTFASGAEHTAEVSVRTQ